MAATCWSAPVGDDGNGNVVFYHVGGTNHTSWWTTAASLAELGVQLKSLPIGSIYYVDDSSPEFEVVNAAGIQVPLLDDDFDMALVPAMVASDALHAIGKHVKRDACVPVWSRNANRNQNVNFEEHIRHIEVPLRFDLPLPYDIRHCYALPKHLAEEQPLWMEAKVCKNTPVLPCA